MATAASPRSAGASTPVALADREPLLGGGVGVAVAQVQVGQRLAAPAPRDGDGLEHGHEVREGIEGLQARERVEHDEDRAAAARGSAAGAVAPERTACQAAKTARSSSGRASAAWASAGMPSVRPREELGALGGGGARRLGIDRRGDSPRRRRSGPGPEGSRPARRSRGRWPAGPRAPRAARSRPRPRRPPRSARRRAGSARSGVESATRAWTVSTTSGAGTPRRSSAAA